MGNKKTSSLSRFFIPALFLGVALVLSGVWYWKNLTSPVNPDAGTKAFIVYKGETVSSIAQRLEQEGLVRSGWVFKLLLKLSGDGDRIEAGDFKLSGKMSAEEIIKNLRSGASDRWVTLLEGWRVEEMAQEINATLKIDKDQFIRSAKADEGYLFPDTYLFNRDATAKVVIQTLKDTFNKRYSDDLKKQIRDKGLTADQGVILASIVEREARSDQARIQVASILVKRLQIGMALNADATIQYALGYQPAEKSWWKRHLSADDLKVDSPYNTYLHAGLPPTPISNPSLSSLKAVASADPGTPYLYYYHDSQGNSYYARTLEEHNANVANHP